MSHPDTANHGQSHGHAHGAGQAGADAVKDPVCGMTVNPATTTHWLTHAGRNYFFCCGGCRDKFRADPTRYLGAPGTLGAGPKSVPAAAVPGSTFEYTCPMHPEVVQTSRVAARSAAWRSNRAP